jgi:predicted Rdx family selenoprotein
VGRSQVSGGVSAEAGESFSAEWLELREPVDHRSRAAAILDSLCRWWNETGNTAVVDLGSGTGSNMRYLAPRLPGGQAWTLVDRERELLSRVVAPSTDVDVALVPGDLAVEGLDTIAGAGLVTASALLDLVTREWLGAVAEACANAGAGALFALTYDGTMVWKRDDRDDGFVRDAFNTHQRRDKGLGPALGPDAGRAAEEAFRRSGYRTWVEASPWRLGPEDCSLALEFVSGCARAAIEQAPARAERARAWAERRNATITSGEFALTVGHVDVLALP